MNTKFQGNFFHTSCFPFPGSIPVTFASVSENDFTLSRVFDLSPTYLRKKIGEAAITRIG